MSGREKGGTSAARSAMWSRRLAGILAAAGALISSPLAAAPQTFEEKIRPILKANCLPCHNAGTHTSGFTVKDLESVLAGGARYGPAVKPGLPSESPLTQLLRGTLEPRMPFGKILPEEEIAAIEKWIEELKPEVAGAKRSHWAYIKPVKPLPPSVRNAQWVRNKIDSFILKKLEDRDLTPAAEATRRVLIRRLYFDVIGLPPSPEEVKTFVDDPSPEAYEHLVNRLLADPHYGERWGRHWLDLARYADTNGFEGDKEFPTVWRYRAYVIDAFNNDKPYDEFIKEQVAGDEFIQDSKLVIQPPPPPERVVAMTFLRLAPYEGGSGPEAGRDSILTEMTNTTSSVFLGLTVGCAKCHDHKYDPIPQKDFYRMKAFFASVQISKGGTEPAEYYRPGEKEKFQKLRTGYKKELESTEAELTEFRKPLLAKLAERWKQEKPAGTKGPGTKDLDLAINNDNCNQNSDFDKTNRLFSIEEETRYLELSVRIKRYKRAIARVEPGALSVRNVEGPPFGPSVPATFVQIRGEVHNLGERVEPGFLSCITGNSEPAKLEKNRFASQPSHGRRMTLAKWIASSDNPLTARVMVNRIWQYHFGRGIVGTPSNFGRNGSRPTHPELLDWLAHRFIEEKWSVKAIHRLILTSSTYRQSSSQKVDGEAVRLDPDDRWLWRFPRRRLEAEEIRDSVLAVSGRLNPEMGGLPVFPPLPEDLGDTQKVKGLNTWETSPGPEADRRSIYIFQRRSLSFPFLATLDAPVPNTSCARRTVSTTPLQALALYNGEFVNEQAKYLAARVKKEAGPDVKEQIERAFELAYSRKPSESEIDRAARLLDGPDTLTGLCRVLLNTTEFIYVD